MNLLRRKIHWAAWIMRTIQHRTHSLTTLRDKRSHDSRIGNRNQIIRLVILFRSASLTSRPSLSHLLAFIRKYDKNQIGNTKIDMYYVCGADFELCKFMMKTQSVKLLYVQQISILVFDYIVVGAAAAVVIVISNLCATQWINIIVNGNRYASAAAPV